MKKVILLALLMPLLASGRIVDESRSDVVIEQYADRLTGITAHAGDVIISEIMADPIPAVALPEREYIEIYNRTIFSFNLNKWKLCSGDRCASFPESTIRPGEYLILCSHTDTAKFSQYGRVVGFKSFPSLPGETGTVYLTDSLGALVHGLEYSSEWCKDKLKESGGWALEIIDTGFPFFNDGNWEASSSRTGGTPGAVNSTSGYNPDLQFYGLENVFPEDSVTLNILFSETVIDFMKSTDIISVGMSSIRTIASSDPLLRNFIITTNEPFQNGTIYSFRINGNLTDFAGNEIDRGVFRFGIPERADRGDIVFNELLFNPFPDDPDYVEFFNCSEKIIDASKLYLVSINPETGDTSDIKNVSGEHRCLIPGSFYTITPDPDKVIARYISSDPESIFRTSSLPSMPDDKGHLLLLNREMDLIDEVNYTEKIHYSLLSDNEGISIEKIRPDLQSDESSNWHSASESSGWGTPGSENSVFSRVAYSDDRVIFSSGRISPDNNGYEDVLVIDFNLEGIGNVLSVTIFDETGSYVRGIAENYYAGDKASLVWDGTSDDGTLVDTGIYIFLIQLYNDKGKIRTWKKVCTVIR